MCLVCLRQARFHGEIRALVVALMLALEQLCFAVAVAVVASLVQIDVNGCDLQLM